MHAFDGRYVHAGKHVGFSRQHGVYLRLDAVALDGFHLDAVCVAKHLGAGMGLRGWSVERDAEFFLQVDIGFGQIVVGAGGQQGRGGRSVRVGGVIELLRQRIVVRHGSHDVDLARFHHGQQGGELLVDASFGLDELIAPSGVLRHLLEVVVGVARIGTVSVRFRQSRLDRPAYAYDAVVGYGVGGSVVRDGGCRQRARRDHGDRRDGGPRPCKTRKHVFHAPAPRPIRLRRFLKRLISIAKVMIKSNRSVAFPSLAGSQRQAVRVGAGFRLGLHGRLPFERAVKVS